MYVELVYDIPQFLDVAGSLPIHFKSIINSPLILNCNDCNLYATILGEPHYKTIHRVYFDTNYIECYFVVRCGTSNI